MQELIITRLAKHAKKDGLSLPWSMRLLMEKLQRDEQRIGALRGSDTRAGDSSAQQIRLEMEALALVLEAVRQAYPAGADITVP